MPDILIRNLDETTVRRLDQRAKELGLPRAEFMRRILTSEAERRTGQVTQKEMDDFAATFADLTDPEVMRAAWS